MTIQELDIADIAKFLANHQPDLKPVNQRGHAAVAMLLRKGTPSPEVLFIVRAKHDQDPWSGNIGFPGGRLDHQEETPQKAAERETYEELMMDLGQAIPLGRLDDLYGAIMPVLVSCFVYHVPGHHELYPNHEIETTFWCPLNKLLEPDRHHHRTFYYRGENRAHPAVTLLGQGAPFLWGITYRLIRNFFEICGHDFGVREECLYQQSSS